MVLAKHSVYHPAMHLSRLLILCFLATFGPPALLPGDQPFPIHFQPDWFANGQFAGFYSAVDEGFYAEAGLDVEIGTFAFGSPFIENVATNKAQFGTIEGYILMNAIAKGQPLVALGAVLQTSPGGYIFLKELGIQTGADLAGKRVGIHAYAEELLPYFIKAAGVDPSTVTAVPVKNDIEKLLSGEIDLLQGYAIDEYLQVKRQTSEEVGFLTFEELGLPMYSMVLYTSRDFADEHTEVVEKFMTATARGWEFALEHPVEAASTLIEAQGESHQPQTELVEQIKAMRPFVKPGGRGILKTNKARWEIMNKRFLEVGLIDKIVEIERLLGN